MSNFVRRCLTKVENKLSVYIQYIKNILFKTSEQLKLHIIIRTDTLSSWIYTLSFEPTHWAVEFTHYHSNRYTEQLNLHIIIRTDKLSSWIYTLSFEPIHWAVEFTHYHSNRYTEQLNLHIIIRTDTLNLFSLQFFMQIYQKTQGHTIICIPLIIAISPTLACYHCVCFMRTFFFFCPLIKNVRQPQRCLWTLNSFTSHKVLFSILTFSLTFFLNFQT